MRSACLELLKKDPNARMTMCSFVTSAAFNARTQSIPLHYKPRTHVEERLRRAHVRQLAYQIDTINQVVSQMKIAAEATSALALEEPPAPALGAISRRSSMSERGFTHGDEIGSLQEARKRLESYHGEDKTDAVAVAVVGNSISVDGDEGASMSVHLPAISQPRASGTVHLLHGSAAADIHHSQLHQSNSKTDIAPSNQPTPPAVVLPRLSRKLGSSEALDTHHEGREDEHSSSAVLSPRSLLNQTATGKDGSKHNDGA